MKRLSVRFVQFCGMAVVLFSIFGLLFGNLNAQAETHVVSTPVVEQSSVRSGLFGGVRLRLGLTESVPYKVRYLDNPYRIVIEFQGLSVSDWPIDFGKKSFRLDDFAFGNTLNGARLVLHFDKPHRVEEIAYTNDDKGTVLNAQIGSIDTDRYDALITSVAYEGRDLGFVLPQVEGETDKPLILIDAGHGGVDPGAVRDNIREKDITLAAAQRIKMFLTKSGRYRVAMTRDDDVFLTLTERRRHAEKLQADLFLSIHADTVEVGDASGMALYLLSQDASSASAAKFAEFENRVDVFAGAFIERQETDLTMTLLDMAQRSSTEKARRLADILSNEWQSLRSENQFVRVEHAEFAVLKAPEVPSLLLEIGFLSNVDDRARLQDPQWLGEMAQSVLVAVDKSFNSKNR